MALGNQPVGQTHGERLGRLDRPAGENQVHGPRSADQSDLAPHAFATGKTAGFPFILKGPPTRLGQRFQDKICGVLARDRSVDAEILQLARDYDAVVVMDDSHATGVLGKTGRGTAEPFIERTVERRDWIG